MASCTAMAGMLDAVKSDDLFQLFGHACSSIRQALDA
jgi:hypothetical protein